MYRNRWLIIVFVFALLLAGCSTAATAPAPTAAPAAQVVAATAKPAATDTPPPTVTTAPTDTPAPTATLTPAAAEATALPREAQLVSPVGMDGVLVKGTDGLPWWNDTVFYEIFVRSFFDSDADGIGGDGIGDLPGLIEKLNYLNDGNPETTTDLGVTGVWLMPIMASPSYHGYDVTDYYKVNPQYGTNDDFKRLMEEAHRRGIRVIVDLVMNHTSSQHPWFIESQQKDSPKRDWYIWADEKPQGSGWHEGPSGGYYYGAFSPDMPDLNYKNPEVTAAMNDVARFWLEEMGVDGFRLDAVKFLIEEGKQTEHTQATLDWLAQFHEYYKSVRPDAFAVGEIWNNTDLVAKYVPDKVDIGFEFDLAAATLDSAIRNNKASVVAAQEKVLTAYPPGQFATFLANHDQDRARTRLTDDEKAKAAASLQLLFGGVPFIYYGEEIGMTGSKPDENIRRPLQWTAEGGFTTGTPWREYAQDVAERNIAGQDADPNSLLNHYRALMRLRNEHAALRAGDWLPVSVTPEQPGVYASLRSTENESILVLINLSNKPVEDYSLNLDKGPLAAGVQPVLLMGQADALYAPSINESGGFTAYRPVASLPPRSTYVIQLTP
jgi:alpha-amylase